MTPDDAEGLCRLSAATGNFRDFEIEGLGEVFNDYFEEKHDLGHRCAVLVEDEQLAGFVYVAPEDMSVSTWGIWWIVVRPDIQGGGRGRTLMHFAEELATNAGGTHMFIETSSVPKYAPTWRFYEATGYEREALLRDFYAPGDDQVIYRKVLPAQNL